MEAIVQARSVTNDFTEARDGLTILKELPITNDAEKEFAAEGLRWVKEQHAELEKKRTAITKPMNTALKEVNDLFRPMKTAFEDAERVVKKKIVMYLEEKEKKNLAAIQAAAAAQTHEQASEELAKVSAAEAPRGVSIRYGWVFEITDASKVPREFLAPSMEKIRNAVQASDGAVQIPGVRIYQESMVTSRKVK